MDTTPYRIAYRHGDTVREAEVKPCCGENNVVDYAIYIDKQLAFNITKSGGDNEKWVISLKNADRTISDDIIQNIGLQIAQHNSQ